MKVNNQIYIVFKQCPESYNSLKLNFNQSEKMNSLSELKSLLPDCEDYDFSDKSLEKYQINCEIGHGAYGKVSI